MGDKVFFSYYWFKRVRKRAYISSYGYQLTLASSSEVLLGLMQIGLRVAFKVVFCDGALAFWKAFARFSTTTLEQCRRVYKTVNVIKASQTDATKKKVLCMRFVNLQKRTS
jgi:hypothetical protein